MPDNISAIGGNVTLPLISFYSIIDEDIAVLKYAILKFSDNPYFDITKISDMTFHEIVGKVYMRKYINPLYLIKSDNIPESKEDLLDRVYEELRKDMEDKILDHAIFTEMYRLVIQFSKSSDIVPYILYYTDSQKKVLESINDFNDIEFCSVEEVINNPDKFSQFYFRYVAELDNIDRPTLGNKTYYFSTSGLNLNHDNSDIIIDRDTVIDLIKRRNKISLYDMYRTDIIGSY